MANVIVITDEGVWYEFIWIQAQECHGRASVSEAFANWFSPDLVLLDADLEQLNWPRTLELVRHLSQRRIGVIVAATHHDYFEAQQALEAGALDYFQKDWDREALWLRVRRALRKVGRQG